MTLRLDAVLFRNGIAHHLLLLALVEPFVALMDPALFQFYRFPVCVFRRNGFAVVRGALVIHPLVQLGLGIQRKHSQQGGNAQQRFRIFHHFTP